VNCKAHLGWESFREEKGRKMEEIIHLIPLHRLDFGSPNWSNEGEGTILIDFNIEMIMFPPFSFILPNMSIIFPSLNSQIKLKVSPSFSSILFPFLPFISIPLPCLSLLHSQIGCNR